jgi:hypothetical protein
MKVHLTIIELHKFYITRKLNKIKLIIKLILYYT